MWRRRGPASPARNGSLCDRSIRFFRVISLPSAPEDQLDHAPPRYGVEQEAPRLARGQVQLGPNNLDPLIRRGRDVHPVDYVGHRLTGAWLPGIWCQRSLEGGGDLASPLG